MSTNEQQTIYRCSRCNYFSDRKYNYTRHLDNVHNIKYQNRDKFSEGENVTPSTLPIGLTLTSIVTKGGTRFLDPLRPRSHKM